MELEETMARLRSPLSVNQRAYDKIAQAYSEANYEADIGKYLGYLPTVTEETAILDLGCGPGNNIRLFSTLNPRRIVGIDNSKGMLDKARRNIGDSAIVDLVLSEFQKYETDDKFDIAIANLAFVHVSPNEITKILGVVSNCLTYGGSFFANYFEGSDESRLLKSYWGKPRSKAISVERQFYFHSVQLLRKAYSEAGFEIDSLEREIPNFQAFSRINIFAHKT